MTGVQLHRPVVSVVIPTRFRPELVTRAVQSALAQSLEAIEVIVVIDGPDEVTEEALQAIKDPRVRVLALEENVGGSEARNIGIRAAQSAWIALLDDDDEWHQEKLAKQLAAAQSLSGSRVIVTCQYYDDKGATRLLRPRTFPRPGEAISDFLYSKVSWLGTIEGFPQTSTWFVSRGLLLKVPFRKGLKRNQDTDWILQALQLSGVKTFLVQEPLSIFHNEVKRKRITQVPDWKDSYNWAMHNKHLFTPQALSCFLAIMCMNHAGKGGMQWRVFFTLLRDCRTYGRITPKVVWLLVLYGLVYPNLRQFISPERRQAMLYRASSAGRSTP
ncbi:glycosyltransferase family 2 protein [Acidipila rosea]|uniref:Glycosyl transferase family 2 n=1 Tax=Acidipila rosea TaxID=768535 RepID=A0A4R1LBQ8_9BACT|nr:glycosyltransferase [Acidipila rosea]TCK75802.1 glycosyl transferase family 2 [Acidipila rosea]